ncbi:prepilin-type N-terminal cleavage/methylation domain-containing protein [Clostridium formicaceticum]|uniref:Type II secretion system protein G n=1 Tax=Clostridium formicaceticum TaxID=1497 RepID=A0AAC9RNM3_9CLOT|nr:prepilin-type N-terminal cleavage/methylation domain-containing protein [Clostridium formicaceticum]AOY77045.1 hypothetical protein BJL90_15010 [Clostridium formicaceticum]ARE87545.1 Type II secretion system protein G precursor [Clostridium formicaceticum]
MIQYLCTKVRNKKGFTLIELIVVIAILGILAGIAVPRFTNVGDSAKISADEATARTIVGAVNLAIAAGDLVIHDGDFVDTTDDSKISEILDFLSPKYLEPGLKSQSGTFNITVDANGAITITNGSVTLYPKN